MTTPTPLEAPTFLGRLIEARTLAAGNVRRRLLARLDWPAVPDAALRQADEILHTARGRAALPTLLGFEFDARRLTAEELLARLILADALRREGARTIIYATIPYQGRPRWDLYAKETQTLVIFHRLCTEADALNYLVHSGLSRVIWSPRLRDTHRPESWFLLEYSRPQPAVDERRWFEESSAVAEEESATRRQLLLESTAAEDELPALQSRLEALRHLLEQTRDPYLVQADPDESRHS